MSLVIYTDGSCWPTNGGPGGWAFVVICQDGRVAHEASGSLRRTTNNRAELIAIGRAMRWAGGRQAVIHSDSQVCVNTLSRWSAGWRKRGWRKSDGDEPANLDLIIPAYELYLASNCRLQWVRGHAGNEFNERADELAGLARLAVTPDPLRG